MDHAKTGAHRPDPKIPILISHAKLGGLTESANTFPYCFAHNYASARNPLAFGEIPRRPQLGKPNGIHQTDTLKIRKDAISVALFKGAQSGRKKIGTEEVICVQGHYSWRLPRTYPRVAARSKTPIDFVF